MWRSKKFKKEIFGGITKPTPKMKIKNKEMFG
jgi:hypothetical protein